MRAIGLTIVFFVAFSSAADANPKPTPSATPNIDDQVFDLLSGYYQTTLTRDKTKLGHPIIAIELSRPSYTRPNAAELAKEKKKPLAEAESELMRKLRHLRSLKSLDLGLSGIQDNDLVYLKNLPSLKRLDMLYCENVTLEGLKQISGLKLKTFVVPVDLRGPEATQIILRNLHEPDLIGSYEWAIDDNVLKQMGQFTSAKSLVLTGRHEITDEGLLHLAALKNLESIDISNHKISGKGLSVLRNFKKVRELDIESNSITDEGLLHLRHLTHLEELRLVVPKMTDKAVQAISTMTKLKMIYIKSDHVTGATFHHFKKLPLVSAAIHCPQLSDAGAANLAKCNKLVVLTIGRSKLTARGLHKLSSLELRDFDFPTSQLKDKDAVKHYIDINRNETSFHFHGGSVTDTSIGFLLRPKQIKLLAFAGSPITDEGIKVLSKRKDMGALDFTNCQNITDASMATVAKFPGVRELVIAKTPITDAGLKHLVGMNNLKRLFIDGSKITYEGAQAFRKQRPDVGVLGKSRPDVPMSE